MLVNAPTISNDVVDVAAICNSKEASLAEVHHLEVVERNIGVLTTWRNNGSSSLFHNSKDQIDKTCKPDTYKCNYKD